MKQEGFITDLHLENSIIPKVDRERFCPGSAPWT